jgi:hypothetical protein
MPAPSSVEGQGARISENDIDGAIKMEVPEADPSMGTVQEILIVVSSPVLITGNCAVTLYVLRLIYDRAPEVSAWILPIETPRGSPSITPPE